MLDRWMQNLVASAMAAYTPKLKSMAESRKQELLELKSKIETHPEEVKTWFDKELEKLDHIDLPDMLSQRNNLIREFDD